MTKPERMTNDETRKGGAEAPFVIRASSFVIRHLAFLLALNLAAAGAEPPPGQDPLMQLMMSQPPVDLTSPVTPTAVFDPPVVRPGEKTIYRVTFNALEPAIEWPEQIKAP